MSRRALMLSGCLLLTGCFNWEAGKAYYCADPASPGACPDPVIGFITGMALEMGGVTGPIRVAALGEDPVVAYRVATGQTSLIRLIGVVDQPYQPSWAHRFDTTADASPELLVQGTTVWTTGTFRGTIGAPVDQTGNGFPNSYVLALNPNGTKAQSYALGTTDSSGRVVVTALSAPRSQTDSLSVAGTMRGAGDFGTTPFPVIGESIFTTSAVLSGGAATFRAPATIQDQPAAATPATVLDAVTATDGTQFFVGLLPSGTSLNFPNGNLAGSAGGSLFLAVAGNNQSIDRGYSLSTAAGIVSASVALSAAEDRLYVAASNLGSSAVLEVDPRTGQILNQLNFGGTPTGQQVFSDLTLDAFGNLWLAGTTRGTVVMTPLDDLVAPGEGAATLVQLSPANLRPLAAKVVLSGTATTEGTGVAINSAGRILVSGAFQGTASFEDGVPLGAAQGRASFVALMEGPPTLVAVGGQLPAGTRGSSSR